MTRPGTAPSTPTDDDQLLAEQLSKSRPGSGRARRGASRAPSAQLKARMEKLALWQEKSKGLRVVVPMLPKWAEGAVIPEAEEERWEQGVLGLERAAYKEISSALEVWQKETSARLNRLEAYGLPSPTERRSLEELGRTLKTADLGRSLELYEKIAAVVTMKERNLNDAIDSVEAVKILAADMEAVGLPPPWRDPGVGTRLESELRDGKVSEAQQEAAELRRHASSLLGQALPSKVNEAAEGLVAEKGHGSDVKAEAGMLAKAARALRQGRHEDALHELVKFQSRRTLDPFAIVEQQLKGEGG